LQNDGDDEADGDEEALPEEFGPRRYSKNSKDHRPDLPRMMVGDGVHPEREPGQGVDVPGIASGHVIVREVKHDLRGWNLAGASGCWIAASPREAPPAARLSERDRRYHTGEGNLRVKDVRIDDGVNRDPFVICGNPERDERDRSWPLGV
jgi:hypothetical protein